MSSAHPGDPSRLPHESLRRTLRAFNANACARVFYDSVCCPSTFVFVGLALSLGLAKEHVGLLTTLVSLGCVAQFAVLPALEHVRNVRRFVVLLSLAEPILLVGIALALPWMPVRLRLGMLGVAVFLASVALQARSPLYDNWLACAIPVGARSRFLGFRLQILSVCAIAGTFVAGEVAERVDKGSAFALGLILAGGGVFGVLSALSLVRADVPQLSQSMRVTWRDARDVFRLPDFRRCIGGMMIFNIPFFFLCPYYQVMHLRVLRLPETRIAWMTIGYLVAKIATTGLWGRYVPEYGARRTMFLSGFLYAAFFATFAFVTPECWWPLWLAWTLVGIADGAWGVAYAVTLYDVLPRTSARPMYFAISSIIPTIASGLGPILAVPVLKAIESVEVEVGPLVFGQFQLYYLGGALVALSTMWALWIFPARVPRDSRPVFFDDDEASPKSA